LVSLSLTCRIVGERGDTYEVTSISQAPVVTVAGAPSDIAPGDYEICGSAYAVYADTHVGVTAETCRKSLFDTGPTPPLNQVRCDYERQATIQAWVVEATAVAGRVDAVPVTTTVWCTVSDGGGEVVHAGGSMLGPVAVATAAERHPVAPLTTVCYGMEARYFAVTDTVTACENY
jgi:hypothetical protein